MAPYVGGKTGTTDEENDAWFVGFTNDTTVAVWVGYDNSDGKRRTLGAGSTGASVAVPIFEPIMESVWALQAPKVALSGPSPEAQRQLIALPIDLYSGDRVSGSGGRAFTEYFRRDQSGRLNETQYRLVSRGDSFIARDSDFSAGAYDGRTVGRRFYEEPNGSFAQGPRYREPMFQGQYGQRWRNDNGWGWREEDDRVRRAPQRIDPDYFFGRRDYR
jgi:membrane peptidoglycan carboxypeptidase